MPAPRPNAASPLPPLPETMPPAPDPGFPGGYADAAQGPGGEGSPGANDGVINPIRIPPHFILRSLRAGCWLINYTPTGSRTLSYDGTMRIETTAQGRTSSGDLSQRPIIPISLNPLRTILGAGPSPAGGIPILSRLRYRYYVRVTQLLEHFTTGGSFPLGFELHRFTAATGAWALDGAFTATMTWIAAPSGYPAANSYLEGDVRNTAGAVVGRLKMGWVSPRLRRVSVEIDAVAGSERPQDNGTGIGWAQVFDAVNWEGNVVYSDTNVAEPSGAAWSDAEMHAAMLARRDAVSLDSQWRYHILAVKTIDSTPRGIMYDAGGTDSNNVPREGVGIATNWTIPNTAEWGQVRGQRFGATPSVFFRTAVHELGHAFGLYHNTIDNGFMNTTDVIAANATASQPFPTNISWAYAANDLKRLRHFPDIFVRPGGTAFGTASSTAPLITPDDEDVTITGLELRVTPLLGEAPIGAPIRVKLQLANIDDAPIATPATLSLKSEFVRGWVTDPSGVIRSFSSMVRCIEERPMRVLEPGETVEHDMTLMRGAEGALFPAGGLFTITAEVRWEAEDGGDAIVRGETTVLVTGAQNAGHAAAAHTVLATPDAHVVLVVGGDHLEEGIAAIQTGVADKVLRPHFAAIEAKRLVGLDRAGAAKKGAARNAKAAVSGLLDETSVMSESELVKLAKLMAPGTRSAVKGEARKDMVESLKQRAEHMQLDEEGKEALAEL